MVDYPSRDPNEEICMKRLKQKLEKFRANLDTYEFDVIATSLVY